MASQPQPAPPATSSPPSSSSSSSLYSRFHAYPFAHDAEYQAGLASILGHSTTTTAAAAATTTTTTTDQLQDANPGLVLNAKLFYFAQRHNLPPNTLSARGYVDWLRSQTRGSSNSNSSSSGGGGGGGTAAGAGIEKEQGQSQQQEAKGEEQPQPQQATKEGDEKANDNETHRQKQDQKQEQQPPYPSSFSAIIDLITSNKPVPGIEQIPDTVLEPGSSKVDRTPRRRKPWEKGDEVVATAATAADSDQTSSIIPPGEAEKEQTGKPGQTGDGLLRILQPNAIPPSGLLAHND